MKVSSPSPDWLKFARLFGVRSRTLSDGSTELIVPGPCHNYDPDSPLHCLDYEHRPEMCRGFLCPAAKEASA
jgi:Fe-S-cluster containining protein